MRVEDREVDAGHDAYLAIIGAHAEQVGDAMLSMASAAGRAARSLNAADLATAEQAMESVSRYTADFLGELSTTHCPPYLRGANDQLQGALKLIADGGQRGAAAARARDGEQLTAAAAEIDTANGDIMAAAQRIADWRSGTARP
jgi:hypothetical protein